MANAALLLTRQPKYTLALSKLLSDLNNLISDIKLNLEAQQKFRVTIVCDNMGSVLFHDLLVNFTNHECESLEFEPDWVFYLGSSLGYVLSFYRHPIWPPEIVLHNLFFKEDASATRLEHLLLLDERAEEDSNPPRTLAPFKLPAFQDIARKLQFNEETDLFPGMLFCF